jgi:predicted phosphodiesterase
MLALLYDVHGNLPALEAVLVDAEAAGATGFVLGGDYTMGGAWPAEVVARLDELGADAAWIRGNTDRWVAGDDTDRPAAPVLDGALAFAGAALDPGPPRGWPTCRPSTAWTARCAATPPPARTWRVRARARPRGRRGAARPPGRPARGRGPHALQFHRPAGDGIHVLNPGSVGMPLDGDPRAAYALLDPDGRVELRRVAYPVEEAAGALRALGEPWTALFEERLRRASF